MHFYLSRCSLRTRLKYTNIAPQEARVSIASVKIPATDRARSVLVTISKHTTGNKDSSCLDKFQFLIGKQ